VERHCITVKGINTDTADHKSHRHAFVLADWEMIEEEIEVKLYLKWGTGETVVNKDWKKFLTGRNLCKVGQVTECNLLEDELWGRNPQGEDSPHLMRAKGGGGQRRVNLSSKM